LTAAQLFQGLTFKLANALECTEALALRARVYREELGHSGIDRFDEVAAHLIAKDASGRVISALRLVGSEHRPFDLESLADIDPLIGPGRRPAEISRFCTDRDSRQVHRHQLIPLGMLKLTYLYAVQRQLTDLFTLGLPHLANLYRAASFVASEASFDHPTWGKTYLMRLDLLALQHSDKASRGGVARLLLADLPNFLV
jgi:N-acyl-L-homoserine lactone synthetase